MGINFIYVVTVAGSDTVISQINLLVPFLQCNTSIFSKSAPVFERQDKVSKLPLKFCGKDSSVSKLK